MLPVLQDFLRQADCVAEPQSLHILDVNLLSAPDEAQALRELNVYLASWPARHRGVEAYVIEDSPV